MSLSCLPDALLFTFSTFVGLEVDYFFIYHYLACADALLFTFQTSVGLEADFSCIMQIAYYLPL
jgi:hypothetical protein